MTGAENPERHLGAGRGHRLDALVGAGRRQERLQLEHVLRKIVGGVGRPAQGAQGHLIGAGGAPEAEVDATWKQPRQRSELLGDHIGRMVGQHDPTGADTDRAGALGDMGQHDRRGGAGDARHVVVFGNPEAVIAPGFGVPRHITCIVQCAACVGFLRDPDQIQDGQRRH